MRQRSLPRPLDTEQLGIVADHGAEEEARIAESIPALPEVLGQEQRPLAEAQPVRMERATSSRHGGASRTGNTFIVMGLPLSPELAAIALGA